MKRLCVMIAVIVALSFNCRVYANSDAEQILRAVVKIHSIIPKSAPSTETLGTEREGNGVVIDAEGTILTLSFLVRDAEKIEVFGTADEPVNATLAGYDYSTGLAILRTENPLGLAPIKFGQSSTVNAGDPVLIAGFGGGGSVQRARIISRKEFAGSWEYLLDEAIFTAPAFPDFSGSALIDSEGHLVGIGYLYTPVVIQGYGILPSNMFIPIDLLASILEDMKTVGRSMKAQRPWLGINAEEAKDRIFITRVTSGGPAEKAGLKPGDIVLMVDGKEVKGLSDFYRSTWGLGNAGVTVPLTVLQGVKVMKLMIRSGDRQNMPRPKPHKGVAL